jgi:hypothetical protein
VQIRPAPVASSEVDLAIDHLRPIRRIAAVLFVALAVVLLVNLVAIVVDPWRFPLGHHDATIAFEGGPWTWLSVGLLLVTAWALVAATRDRADRRWWLAVAAGFVYLAVDEGLMVHERFNDVVGSGNDAYGWALPGAVLALGAALPFARWFFRLEPPLRNQLLVAALLFIGGAIGFEVLAGMRELAVGFDRVFFVLTTIEEVLEVAGPMLVLLAMLRPAPRGA